MDSKPNIWDRVAVYAAAIGVIATLVAVVVSIWLANKQVNEMRDEVKIQHLMDEASKFDQDPILASRKSLAAQRIDRKKQVLLPLDPDDPPSGMWDLLNECEQVGLLTKRGYLDVDDVWNEMGYWFLDIYADAEPSIESDRKGSPTSKPDLAAWANCTWLIEQMRPIELNEGGGTELHPSQDDLYHFYAGEVGAKPGQLPPHRGKQ